ncbi:hypothetical protein [Devriesea agamarum]|uniref:hypothetical protein n=1 Tax=Devriesea agamarum TaxID=472569 RepID=UPI00155E74C3|nr:hypothetical protein [Devriesea agamarum]
MAHRPHNNIPAPYSARTQHAAGKEFTQISTCPHGSSIGRKWGMLETYGGKLVENIIQAIARDLCSPTP